jgi:anti-anti-sigma regulatory factor
MDADASVSEPAVQLPSQCALRDARALQTTLTALLATPAEVTLDASAVQRIDTATLQLLVAFAIARRAAGRALRWHSPTTVLVGAAERLGLEGALQLPALK